MRTMGFCREERKETSDVLLPTVEEPKTPVKSLVRVRFEDADPELTYYNDRFDLKPGNRVFVSGKRAGEIGIVSSVSTKFRIRLSDFERVIALAQTPIRGTYKPAADKMLSYDSNALSPEAFRAWVMPPEEEDDGILCGDGCEIPLDDPHNADDVDRAVFDRAIDYCNSGRIGYISVRDGIGHAYVEGRHWYELDFRIRDNMIEEAYCGCPYPGLCKHLLAVAVTLSAIAQHGDLDLGRDFVLIDANRFFEMVKQNGQTVAL